MTLDKTLIRSLSGFEELSAGFADRFLTPVIGGGRTIAVLSTPLGSTARLGWVICHSFGPEQDNLQGFEAALARQLAETGFPALRFHAQGYGDSELDSGHASLGTQVRDSIDAVGVLVEQSGVEAIGLIGARFGGAIAALVAEHVGAQAVALLDPVVWGRNYLRFMIRSDMALDMTAERGPDAQREDPTMSLQRDGVIDIQGFPVRAETFTEISSLDLTRELRSFRGRSLVLQLSRSAAVPRELRALIDHLEVLGGVCRHEVLVDPGALKFGLPRYRGVSETKKVDVLAGVDTAVLAAVVTWCRDERARLQDPPR